MSASVARTLAQAILATTLACVVVGAALMLAAPLPGLAGSPGDVLSRVIVFGTALTYAATGALVAVRQPRNAVPWIIASIGLLNGFFIVCAGWAEAGLLVHPGVLPGAPIAAWLTTWEWAVLFGLAVPVAVLLYPDGRVHDRLSPIVLGYAALMVFGYVLATALAPGDLDGYPGVANPFGVAWPPLDALRRIEGDGGLSIGVPLIASGVLMLRRLHGARGVERQQLKWFIGTASVTAIALPIAAVAPPPVADIAWNVGTLAICVLPVAITVAILRYRLYEIDRLLNRTLVYGALGALLGVVYAAVVLLVQALFADLVRDNGIAVAASTLVVAALFRPARALVQRAVDRRFDRRRYDAERTIERFATQLRDQIDLDSLTGELLGIVNDALGPAHATIWLRPAVADGGRHEEALP